MFIAIGIVGFYLIYRLEFRWYVVSVTRLSADPTGGPMFLLNPRAHYFIHAVAILLFCGSTFCLYKASPWLVLLAPVAILGAWVVHVLVQAKLRDRTIAMAATLAVAEQRKGSSRVQINDAICLATLGRDCELGLDHDPKMLLRVTILPKLGLMPMPRSLMSADADSNSHVMKEYAEQCAEIDAKFDDAVRREKAKRASTLK
ncbi:MAG TPA: hypothetical protein VFU48_08310 [Nitrospira sp.]|nr:hypothetical protein [Nitrospira sp.]